MITEGEDDNEGADIVLTEEDLGGDSIEALTPETPEVPETPETPAAPEVPEEPEAPAPRTPRAENRFQKLTAERDAERDRAAAAEARAEAAEAAKQQADTAMIAHWHGRLEVERDAVTSQLKQAKVDGDTDTEIALQTRLNTIAQNLATTTEALREAPRAAPEQAPPAPRPAAPAPVEQPTITYKPETQAWLERNSWFLPQSPEYDHEMGEEARLYAKRIERRFKAEGKIDAIGSTEYFKDIDNYIRQEFPDAFPTAAPAQRAVPPMTRDTTVAPVNRGGAPDASAPPNSRTVRLSADERQFAHQMAANGAFRKDDGTRPTNAEAERLYAAQKLKTAR